MRSNRGVRNSHRALSFVLSLIMMISLIPASVFADEDIKDPTETEGIEETVVIPEEESDAVQESEPEEETQPEIVPEDLPEEPEQNQDLELEVTPKTLKSDPTEYKFITQPAGGSALSQATEGLPRLLLPHP